MKAIETYFDGYRFRSRLEARWAVFFKTLGVKYKYEHQDYVVRDTRYLPDFWLPEQDCWFEVKGDSGKIGENYDLYSSFSSDIGPLVVFTDLDIDIPGIKFILCDHDSNGGLSSGDIEWYCCARHGFQLSLRCSYRCTVFTDGYNAIIQACNSCDLNSHDPYHPQIVAAYNAARQARFEHGERGGY